MILGVVGFGVSASNIWAITQTLAGQRATGRWVGFQSFFGNMSGTVAPAVTGYVLQRTGQFYWAFLIVAAVAFAGAMSWILLVGRVEPVIWDRSYAPPPRPCPPGCDPRHGIRANRLLHSVP